VVGSPERKRTKQGESGGRYKRGKSMVRPEPCSLRRMGLPSTHRRVCHWRENSLRAAIGCKMEVWERTTCTTSAAAFAAPR